MTIPPNMQQVPGQFPPGFQPQWAQQQQPQQQQAPQQQQQPQYQQQPASQQFQQQQQQPQQQPSQAQLDMRIPQNSPDWPRELWGRTMRDALRYYNIMREDFQRRNVPQQQQQPQAPQPQQQQPQAQPQQWNQAPQAPQPQQPSFNGQGAPQDMQSMVNSAIQQALQPYTNVSTEMVGNRVAAQFPDWWQYHQEILGALAGATPELLMNEETWKSAYFLVKGRAMTQNQVPAYRPQPQPGAQQRGIYEPIRTPPPPPPGAEGGYFSEAPTVGAPNGGQADLTRDPEMVMMARKWGLPVAELAQYANGNVPPAQTFPQNNQQGY